MSKCDMTQTFSSGYSPWISPEQFSVCSVSHTGRRSPRWSWRPWSSQFRHRSPELQVFRCLHVVRIASPESCCVNIVLQMATQQLGCCPFCWPRCVASRWMTLSACFACLCLTSTSSPRVTDDGFALRALSAYILDLPLFSASRSRTSISSW